MRQIIHHRPLLAGLLLSAGAVVAVSLFSNGFGSADVVRATRATQGMARPLRSVTEASGASPAAPAEGGVAPLHAAHVDRVSSVPVTGALAGAVTTGGSSDFGFSRTDVTGKESAILASGAKGSGTVSTPAFTPEVSFSQDHPWVSHDPSAPGSSLSLDNQTASVTAAQPVSGSNGVALAVVVEDTPPVPAVVSDPAPAVEIETADSTDLIASGPLVRRHGFTHEQELFRAKWGWAAYDQVQKILREETSD